MTGLWLRQAIAVTIVAALMTAPVAEARDWRGHHPYYGGYRGRSHGNAAGAAIIGGLIGLGLGAAIASSGGYAPPPAYYGAPVYAPPPPVVYYGY
jgi:hypothetical protein